ncbi:MAG: DMT family transporter [Rickettsiales bacterium]
MHIPTPDDLRKGYLNALGVVGIWTCFILVSRSSGKSTLTPYDVIALRYAVAAVTIFPLWLRYRTRLWEWRKLVLTLVGAIGFTLLAFNGFRHAPANHAAILMQGFLPFSVTVMAYFIAHERPGRQRLFGLAFIALGVGAMAVDSFSGSSVTFLGDGLLTCASLTWALYTVLLRRWNMPPMDSAIAVTLLAAFIYLPFYVAFLPKNIAATPPHEWLFYAFVQGTLVAVIQMICYTRAVAYLGAGRLAMVTSCVPVLASLFAVPLLDEPLTTPIIIGLVFVVTGAWVGNRRPKAPPIPAI